MTVLVTGAAGLTGGEIVRRAIAGGWDVLSIVRDPERARLVPDGSKIAIADCAEPTALGPLLAHAETLIHVAGILLGPSIARAPELRRPARVVVMSSTGIASRHRRSASLYEAGEAAIRSVRPDALFIRPTMIYGSVRDRNVHHVARFARRFHVLPIFGKGSGLIQPIHFEDLAAATVTIASTGASGIVEAGGAAPLALSEAAGAIMLALGLPERLVYLPMGAAVGVARLFDLVRGSRLTERLQRMTERRTADNSRLTELSGSQPRDFRNGVMDQVARMAWEERLT